MKLRIFISSTFYDLKYIREDLANFVRNYCYEPVLFENGDIGYTPERSLDASCYEAMKNSDMVILIIGGEYGSAASGEKKDEFLEYMSVTRKEFRTAIDSGIPVFVMVDKKVMAEYGVYEANYDLIEKENKEIKFAFTKNINVFRFIKEIKNIVNLPIQEFERSSDIKGFISKQWADMFKNYLTYLRSGNENKKIENSVNEMKNLVQKMSIMLDSVGKNVLLKEDPEEYEAVVDQQEIMTFCNIIADSISLELMESGKWDGPMQRKKVIRNLFEILNEMKDEDLLDINRDNVDYVFNIFHENEFIVNRIVGSISEIRNVMGVLSDEKKQEKAVKILTEDEYFHKLIRDC